MSLLALSHNYLPTYILYQGYNSFAAAHIPQMAGAEAAETQVEVAKLQMQSHMKWSCIIEGHGLRGVVLEAADLPMLQRR